MKKILIFNAILALMAISFIACERESIEEETVELDKLTEELTVVKDDSAIIDDPDGYYSDKYIDPYASENSGQRSSWTNVWTHNFNSLSNWSTTNRTDFNSDICKYRSSQVAIVGIGGTNKAVRLKAQWTGSYYKSGHIKSSDSRKYRPSEGQEYRFRAKIKLNGKNYSNQTKNFHRSSGAWPAF